MCATQPIARTVRAAADKEENRGKPRFCFYMPVHEASAGLFGTGQHLSRHRVSGAYELRERVRSDGAAPFLHRPSGVRELPQAGSPFPGGKFFAEPQRGIRRLRTAGASRRPPRGQKGRTTCGFPSSLNSYLSLASQSGADCLHVTAPKRSTAEDFFFRIFLHLFAVSDNVLLHIWATLRWVRHNSAAQFDSAL